MLRAVIADDEPLARRKIRALLEGEGDVEVVAECANGREAIDEVRARTPDLLFLDIAMPEKNGFDVVRAIADGRMPAVVFVTAHDEYALKAFEVHAVDYLLKPFDRRRFETALTAARTRLAQGGNRELSQRLMNILQTMEQPRRPHSPERITVKKAGRIIFLDIDDIRWVDAAGNYVKLNTGDGSYLLRETMVGIEERLPGEKFLRIHRSTIVNIDEIQEIEPLFHGEYSVTLKGGQRLTLSRSYRNQLGKLMGK